LGNWVIGKSGNWVTGLLVDWVNRELVNWGNGEFIYEIENFGFDRDFLGTRKWN
jgi:hypothetical protein